jgi:hypothetical protein
METLLGHESTIEVRGALALLPNREGKKGSHRCGDSETGEKKNWSN